jgi:hypothetical protein
VSISDEADSALAFVVIEQRPVQAAAEPDAEAGEAPGATQGFGEGQAAPPVRPQRVRR